MITKDKRIDAYINKSEIFARPILKHLRQLVHQACPEVKETIKWGFPHFDYHGLMCSMAAFKQHCAFGFWKARLMTDTKLVETARSEAAMGHLGKIQGLNDLPSGKILRLYIKEACRLNEAGVKIIRAPRPEVRQKLVVPPDLKKALQGNPEANDVFTQFSYTNKKDYLEWITEAKTAETRMKRLNTAVEWISEGKIRNWKYVRSSRS